MAALSKRDIEMIFRAETDAAQRPVNELSSDVKKLRTSLDDLAKTSVKTDKSLDDLAKSTRDLEKAQSELANAKTLLTQLNAQATALERAEKAADAAGKKYEGLKAQVDAVDKPAKRLTTSMEAAERGMKGANARLEEQRKNYAEVKTSIEGIIGPVDSLQTAFRTVAVAQREITQGLATAKGAVSEFKTEIAGAQAAAAKLGDTEAFKAQASAAGLPTAQVNYLAEQANRTELLAQARKDLMAQDAAFQKAVEAQAAKVGAQNLANLKTQMEETAQAEVRLSQVDAFRTVAASAIAAESAAERVKNAMDGSSTSAQKLASAISGILQPAEGVAKTLDGMDNRLDAVIARMSGGKISVSDWNNLNNELVSIQANLGKVAAEVDNFVAQQSRVDDAAKAYDLQAQKVRELAAAEITADTNLQELTSSLQRQETVLNGLGGALDRETAKLKELGGALKAVGVDSGQLPAAIQRIESTATRAAPAIKKVATAVSPNGKKGFLGLDPFALQNLSYQVNDVFTSLASGISPMQTLAQQGGQIVQIFPGIISSMIGLLPVILPLAAGFGVLAASMGEANAQVATLREANTVIASLGDSNGYDAKKFVDIANAFKDIGVSADDANASAKIFVTEGLNPAAVDDYIIAAKNLATVQGTDVKTATEELTKAFTSGATEVLALDDKLHFLTDTQRTQLEASKDTKNEYIEVNKAFTALYTKMQQGANEARGPMTDATNTLRGAWRSLLGAFADTGVITAVTNYIADAVVGFTFLINLAKRTAGLFKGIGGDIAKGGVLGMLNVGNRIALNIANGEGAGALAGARADTLAQQAQSQVPLARKQSAPGADAGAGSSGRQKDRETQAAKDRKTAASDAKKAAREAAAEAKRRAAEAAALAKQYANEQDQLTSQLSRVTIEALKGQQAPLDQQLQFAKQAVDEQFKALEDRLSEFGTKFGKTALINGMSQSDYAAGLASQKAQIVLSKQLGVYESNVNDLMKSRNERLKQIQDDQKAGLITSQVALDRVTEVTANMGPAIDGAIESARQFIAALTPSNETQALLDKFDRLQNQSGKSGNATIRKTQAIAGVDQNEQKINDVFERRAKLIAAANNLYEAGVGTATDREGLIKLAYTSTNDEITKGIQAAKDYLAANSTMIPPDVLTNANAALELYNTKLKYTTELQQTIKASAEQAFAQGFTMMFDTLAQGIAGLIDGTKSFGDVLADLGRATLQFVANFAKAIAEAIVQLMALRIAKSLMKSFGFHGGGTVGDLGAGRMNLSRNISVPDLSAVPRYHEGTQGAGLKSNEMLAVLEKGEKVQTEEQQHVAAMQLKNARASGSGGGIRQVLAFGDDEIAGAMSGKAGESVTVTHIRRNRAQIRQDLGIKGNS